MADEVILTLLLQNVRQFVSGSHQAAGAVEDIGEKAEQSGKKAKLGWKGVAQWAAGAGVLVGAVKVMKGAVSTTEELAKSTITLQRSTGMETETASEWAALMKERGISTKQFQVGLVKLSKTVETARTGTVKQTKEMRDLNDQIEATRLLGGKSAPAALEKLGHAMDRAKAAGQKSRAVLAQLGVPLSAIGKGDTEAVLNKVADAMQKIERPTERVALAQQLFGKSGQALVPILMKGSEGVAELLQQQKDAGNYISGKGIDSTKKLIEQQREMKRAWQGVQVQLGEKMLPIMVAIGRVIVKVTQFLQPLTKHAWLFYAVIVALTAAFLAYKVAVVIATLMQAGLNVQLLITAGIVGAVILVIAALAIGFYLLYKKVDWFRNAVNAVWSWIKTNWPLLLTILLGPIGLAIALIVRNFKAVKAAAAAVFNWIKGNWPYLVAALAGPFGIAAVLIVKHFNQIKRVGLAVVDAIKRAFESLIAFFRGLPGRIGNWVKKIPGLSLVQKVTGGASSLVHKLPGIAEGGTARRGGLALVGERGPEVVTVPTGATIEPLPAPAPLALGGAFSSATIHTQVILDRRVLAEAVGQHTADRVARR